MKHSQTSNNNREIGNSASSPPATGGGIVPRADVVQCIKGCSTPVQVRKQGRLFLDQSENEPCYMLLDGFLILECRPVAGLRRILRLFYPGDFIRASSVPPISNINLVATVPSRLLRSNWRSVDDLIHNEKVVANYYHQQLAVQEARLALHASIIGGLVAEARVASLLIELASRIGQPAGGGISIDLPLSRGDMADYLALNPDTFSRIVSRLRAKGVLSQSGRERVFTRDWQALLDESPFSAAISAVHSR